MYMHVFSVSDYSPLYLTTNTKKSKLIFSDAFHLDAFFSLTLTFALFPLIKKTAVHLKNIQNLHRQFISIRMLIHSG